MKLDKQYIALQNKMIRMEKMGQKTIAKNYKKVLDDLRISMAKIYESYEIDGQISLQEVSKYSRLQKLDKEVSDMMTNLYKSNSNAIKGTLEGIATTTYSNSIAIVEGRRVLKGIVKELDVAAIVNDDMAGLKWIERMGKHRSDAIWEIQKEIKQGLKHGDTYSTMSKRLKKQLGTDINKANTIVRTEGHRVMGAAKEESFSQIEKAGVTFKEQWLSSRDGDTVRKAHQDLDGVIINRGEMFYSSNGGVGVGPGLMGTANDDCNCRCVKILILD